LHVHDLVIRGGTVVDGSGSSPYRADVAIDNGRIVGIGRMAERGRSEIEAEGRVVTPGFIDGHTHLDAQVFWDPLGSSSCWHGVTTAVMGNCGFTLAPSKEGERALVIRNLERAEDMSPEALAAGIPWSWESFPEYLDAVEQLPKAINYAANLGHSALRTAVMGERAFEEAASEADLGQMKTQLRGALDAGAIGFTTSLSANHATSDDRRVASLVATWSELAALVGVVGEAGGIFELALEHAWRADDPAIRAEASERMYHLAMSTGAPITFGVVPQRSDGADWREKLALIDKVVAAGGSMFAQSHSRGVTNVLSFRTRLPFDSLPAWQKIRTRPVPEQLALLADPAVRSSLVEAARTGEYGQGKGGEPRRVPFEKIRILDRCLPPHRTVAEVAAERRAEPVEVMIDLAVASGFEQLFFQPFSLDDESAIETVLQHPRAVMTFSDSGAHVSQIADASLQTYFLAYWVRTRQVLTLEQAVKKITSDAATGWGFADRGLVREGFVADLNVFDPATIGPDLPVVADDFPAGTQRLLQTAHGIDATVIDGQLVFSNGQHTGALPGRLLRR
jgi:N-acyl-D-amino-acid deacylase